MTDMIEKVARAICEADEHYGGWSYEKRVGEKLASGYSGREILFDEAEAAIEAMREPTDEMEFAGRDEMRRQDPPGADMITRPWNRKVWYAMIDAACAMRPSEEN